MTKPAAPVSSAEAKSLFADFEQAPGLLLAVSGGPDSTALLLLAARWRKSLKPTARPTLLAATVDHGLRKGAQREAAAVKKLAARLKIPHRTLRWTGSKPSTGIQQNARAARYRLLAAVAKKSGATCVVTAHTLDDQAETMLIRMARGSGITGLGAMARQTRLDGLLILRPFLEIPKARLIATTKAAKVAYSEDPSNRDPRFARSRWRELMPELAREGLDARRLSVLARRLRRADAAIEAEVDRVMTAQAAEEGGATTIPAAAFSHLPTEIALRLLGRVIARHGDEGPVELGKLEALFAAALPAAQNAEKATFRRSLAGALVTIGKGAVLVEKAPPRGGMAREPARILTTRPPRQKATPKSR